MKSSSCIPIFEAIFRLYPQAFPTATKEFFIDVKPHSLTIDPEISQSYVGAWFIFTYVLPNGKTPLQTYVEENPDQLSKQSLQVYKTMLDTFHFDIFETKAVRIHRGLTIKGLINNTEYDIREKRATYQAEEGQLCPNWVFKVDTHWEVAASTIALSPVALPLIKLLLSTLPVHDPRELYLALATNRKSNLTASDELEDWIEEHDYSLSVPQVASALQAHGMDHMNEVVTACMPSMPNCSDADIGEFVELAGNLWNEDVQLNTVDEESFDWSPGPIESMLIIKLQEAANKVHNLDQSATFEIFNAKLKVFQNKWIDIPLNELDGMTPRQAVAKERREIGIHPDHDWTIDFSVQAFSSVDERKQKELFNTGIEAMHTNNFAKAEELFTQVVALDPEDFQGWGNLGVARAGQGKKSAAIEAIETALELHPGYTLAQNNLEGILQTPKEDLSALFKNGGTIGSILSTGKEEGAYTTWQPLISPEKAVQTMIVKDAIAFVQWLKEQDGIQLTKKLHYIPKNHLYSLNERMQVPLEVEYSIKSTRSHTITEVRKTEFQFTTIHLLKHLLEATGIIEIEKGKLCVHESAEVWLGLPANIQWIALLWSFFIDLDWADLARNHLENTASHFQEHWLEPCIDEILKRQKHAPNDWLTIDPMTAKKWSKHKVHSNSNNKDMDLFVIALSELMYLWEPLQLFGLVEIQYKQDNMGFNSANTLQITTLGKHILPTLIRRPYESSKLQATDTGTQSVGRNDPCPCGATKTDSSPVKFKKCCGKI